MTVDLYQEKLGLFRTLRQLTDEIAKFTPEQLVREDEAYQRLTELLDERDELMEKIDRLDQGSVGSRSRVIPQLYSRSCGQRC